MYYTFAQPAITSRKLKANFTIVKLVHAQTPGVTIQTLRSAPNGIHIRPTSSPDPSAITVYPYVTYGKVEGANVAYGTTSFGSPPTLAWNDESFQPYGVWTDLVSGDVWVANGNDKVFYWPKGSGLPQTMPSTNYIMNTAYGVGVSVTLFVADGGDSIDSNGNTIVGGGVPAVVRFSTRDDDYYSFPGNSSLAGTFVEKVADGFWLRPFGILVDNAGNDVWVADGGNVTTGGACNGFVARLPNMVTTYPTSLGGQSPVTPVLVGRGWSSPRGLWMQSNGDLWVADAGCGTTTPSFLARVPAGFSSNFTLTDSYKYVVAPVGSTINGVAAESDC